MGGGAQTPKEQRECGRGALTRKRRLDREDSARYRQRKKEQDREAFLRKSRDANRRYRANMSEEKKISARAKNREAKRRARAKKRQSSQKREKVIQVCQEGCKNEEGGV